MQCASFYFKLLLLENILCCDPHSVLLKKLKSKSADASCALQNIALCPECLSKSFVTHRNMSELKIIQNRFPLLVLLACSVSNITMLIYQASVRVKDEEGPKDEAEEEVDGVDVAGGVAGVDEQPAEDDSQLRPRLKNVQPNVGYKGERAGDT